MFLFCEDRRRLKFPDDIVDNLFFLHVDTVDHLPMMDDNLINEATDNVFGQFFRIDGTVTEKIDDFDNAWRNQVIHYLIPIFSENTKGEFVLRFDDVIADALEQGPASH